MSNPSLRQPMGPLSVGNVVSAALVLYRSHLKTYIQLALTAYLWALLPIYGWAKFFAISGTLSRLAFHELMSQPESVSSARSYANSRLWSFWGVAFRVGLWLIGVYFGLLILMFLAILLLGAVMGFIVSLFNNQILVSIVGVLVGILGIIGFLYGFIWFFSRWILAEVPLAVEEDTNGKQSVDRSWELTKNSVGRIQGVVVVAFLVTLPLLLVTSYIPQIFLLQLEPGSSLYWLVYGISLLTSIGSGILVLPFWQATKAVLYYDLRSRREGLGLQLRDS